MLAEQDKQDKQEVEDFPSEPLEEQGLDASNDTLTASAREDSAKTSVEHDIEGQDESAVRSRTVESPKQIGNLPTVFRHAVIFKDTGIVPSGAGTADIGSWGAGVVEVVGSVVIRDTPAQGWY